MMDVFNVTSGGGVSPCGPAGCINIVIQLTILIIVIIIIIIMIILIMMMIMCYGYY